LLTFVNKWLRIGNVRPLLFRSGKKQTDIALLADTFGILAMQLMLAVSRAHTLSICRRHEMKVLSPEEARTLLETASGSASKPCS
jgi:hypothetical protein